MIANGFSFFQLITYGIASAGLFVALYRIRPVSINRLSSLLAVASVLFYESDTCFLPLFFSLQNLRNRPMSHLTFCNHEFHSKAL